MQPQEIPECRRGVGPGGGPPAALCLADPATVLLVSRVSRKWGRVGPVGSVGSGQRAEQRSRPASPLSGPKQESSQGQVSLANLWHKPVLVRVVHRIAALASGFGPPRSH